MDLSKRINSIEVLQHPFITQSSPHEAPELEEPSGSQAQADFKGTETVTEADVQ